MNLVERRKIWFGISLISILPGILFMIWHTITAGTPLPLAIDYTGGTQWEMRFEQPVVLADIRQVFVDAGYSDTAAVLLDDDARTVQFKLKTIDPDQKAALIAGVTARFGTFDERSYHSIGPSIGAEVSRAAILAVVAASALILVYIAFAFREVPHSFRYGTAAIIALIHDVLVTISFLSIMNLVAGWEIDALFLTAALMVIGFSVNDTIVIFDRIRENLRRHRTESYATVANRSLIETAQRSISTQMSAMFIIVAILLFGGTTLQIFMSTLLVGMLSGTYSSIFNAAPIVVAWEERSIFGNRNAKPSTNGQAA